MRPSKGESRGEVSQADSKIVWERLALNLIHESLGSGPWYMEFDQTGQVTRCTWSDTFRQMLGYTNQQDFPDELESWSNLLHEEDKDRVLREYWDTVQDYTGVKTYDVEYRLLTKHKGWRWFHAAGRLARREDGSPIIFFGLFIDIDQRKQLEEQLQWQTVALQEALDAAQYANQSKTLFLNSMSHDIRTPMNAIIGFTNLALESTDHKTRSEYLQNISVSTKHLLDLINKILEFSRVENQTAEAEEELVNIGEIHHKLAVIFRMDLGQKHLSYTMDLNTQHDYFYMDVAHFSQIFLNIISNAIKYTPMGGAISVSCKELPGDGPGSCILETVVQDNGIGMSSEFLVHAYESFSREKTSTISGIQGTGLGLAIVKNLVTRMKGTVHIDSRPNQGTKVVVRIPHRIGSSSDAKLAEEAKAVDTSQLTGKRILLANDIDINAVIASKLLSSKDCLVDRAKDGVECVKMLKEAEAGYYDLVLMDIQMPNMDGYTATRTIRALEDRKKADIPILAMTANALQEDVRQAFESGMNGHIAKPLDAVKMFQLITEILCGK